MQTLTAGQYGALDSLSRNPCARVQVKRNYDSIPFEGKTIQSTLTHERYPKHILHSDGRMCMVYSKYNTTYSKYDLYFKATNIERTVWSASVEVAQSASYDYNYPAIVQINSSDNLGIIVSRAGTDLFSCVVNTSGVIQTALADTTINGTNPSLAKIGSTYWLVYEASGILYYRTSADFVTWSAATNLNTITGLSNNHYSPYIYYDTSDKLWVGFERATNVAVTPNIYNTYFIISSDQGSSWGSPVQMTTYSVGEGSAHRPSIVDTTAKRYFAYTLERQISTENMSSNVIRGMKYDSTRNRMIFIRNDGKIGIYDITNDTYTYYDSGTQAYIQNLRCIDYDEENQIIVVGSYTDGLIIYDEVTTSWYNYTSTTSPSIGNVGGSTPNWVQAVKIINGVVYYYLYGSSSYYSTFGILDVSGATITYIEDGVNSIGHIAYRVQIFVSDNYIIYIFKRSSDVTSYVRVYDLSDNSLLHYTTLSSGNYRSYQEYDVTTAKFNGYYDTTEEKLYIPGTDVSLSHDHGILICTIGDSGVTYEYLSNHAGNANGLLPNPDPGSNKYAYIEEMFLHSGNGRLYMTQIIANSFGGTPTESLVTVFNLNSQRVIEYYAHTGTSEYATNYPEVEALFNKVIPSTYNMSPGIYDYTIAASDDKNVIFQTLDGTYRFHVLATESNPQSIYYLSTVNDVDWTTASSLVNGANDDYVNLFAVSTMLCAFWNELIIDTYELRWDEDLSTEIDVSEYVETITIDKTDEHSSNKASIILSDSIGLFDPLNYSSLLYDYFAENNIITIEKGNNGNYNDAFYGFIGSGESTYKRGEQIVYRLDIWDKSKNFFQMKVTTPLFENQTVEYIADYVAATYMGLAAGQYDTLPSITDIIPTVQFIDECVMDILFKIYQPYNYFPWFDESGNLKAKEYNYDASVDFTYYQDGTDTVAANKAPAMNIIGFDYEWTDKDLVNQVTVIGETEAVTETTFPEEFMGVLQGAAGWYSKSTDFDFWFSTDKSLYCEEPRLSVEDSCGNKFFGGGEDLSAAGAGKQLYCTVHQNVSQLIAALYILIGAALAQWMLFGVGIGTVAVTNPLAAVLAMALTILGQVGSYFYDIYARPVGDALPDTIEATANDTTLQGKYGIVPMEIDNPFLDTYAKCLTLAENELEKSKWFRYILTLRICANTAHQIGDVISAYNPHTNNSYSFLITDIENSYKRGEQDVDILRGGLII